VAAALCAAFSLPNHDYQPAACNAGSISSALVAASFMVNCQSSYQSASQTMLHPMWIEKSRFVCMSALTCIEKGQILDMT
jgi:hypothetical protein